MSEKIMKVGANSRPYKDDFGQKPDKLWDTYKGVFYCCYSVSRNYFDIGSKLEGIHFLQCQPVILWIMNKVKSTYCKYDDWIEMKKEADSEKTQKQLKNMN